MIAIAQYLVNTPTIAWAAVGYRLQAIKLACETLACKVREADLLINVEPLYSEIEATFGFWAMECVLQGAIIREFHIWEIDCGKWISELEKRTTALLPKQPKRKRIRGGRKSLAQRNLHYLCDVQGVHFANGTVFSILRLSALVGAAKHRIDRNFQWQVDFKRYDNFMSALESFWCSAAEHDFKIRTTQ